MAQRPPSISFEEFTATTLRAVKASLEPKKAGPRVFIDPDIIIGIIIRPPRDLPGLENINQLSKGG